MNPAIGEEFSIFFAGDWIFESVTNVENADNSEEECTYMVKIRTGYRPENDANYPLHLLIS